MLSRRIALARLTLAAGLSVSLMIGMIWPGPPRGAIAHGTGGTRQTVRVPLVGADLEGLTIMAQTIWAESRGEPWAGKLAVGFVIKERAQLARLYRIRTGAKRHALYGDGTIAAACLMPQQFSCWNPRDPNLAKIHRAHLTPEWSECLKAAETVLMGLVPNNVGNATHYHTKAVRPVWSRGETPTAVIGAHKFFKLTD